MYVELNFTKLVLVTGQFDLSLTRIVRHTNCIVHIHNYTYYIRYIIYVKPILFIYTEIINVEFYFSCVQFEVFGG